MLILLISVFVSCQKSGGGTSWVYGTISERGSNAPIEGAVITLDQDNYGIFYGYRHKQDITSPESDNEGHYRINYIRNPTARYRASCEHPDYYTAYDETKEDKIKHGRNALNFIMIPKAFVKFRFIRTGASDYYVFGSINNRVYFYSPYYYSPVSNTPYDSIPNEIHTVYGNEVNIVKWNIYSSSQIPVSSIITGSFYVAKGDTATFTINFN